MGDEYEEKESEEEHEYIS